MKNMKKTIFLVALFSLLVLTTSFCSKPGEAIIEKYFQAMGMKDKLTMSSMAIEPKELVYKSYEISELGELVEKDMELPALQEKMKKVTDNRQKQGIKTEDAQYAIDDLKDELADARGSRQKAELNKKIEEAELAFEQEKQKYARIVIRMNSLKKKIDREKELISMSTSRTESLELYTGKTFFQKIGVKVTLENGEAKDYIFLLRSNTLNLEDKAITGRFIITKILTSDEYEAYLKAEEAQAAEEKAAEEMVKEEEQPPAEQNTEEEATTEENKENQ